MKNLIFIDNDREEIAKEDIIHAKNTLNFYDGLSNDIIESMELKHSFGNLDREEQNSIVLNPENVIVTWSMYSARHYGSKYQMLRLLQSAGQYKEVYGIVYLDTSGNIKKTIERAVKFERDSIKDTYALFCGIENNYIITVDDDSDEPDDWGMRRLRVNIRSYDDDILVYEDVNIEQLIK